MAFNTITIWLYCFCLVILSSSFWPSLPQVSLLICCLVASSIAYVSVLRYPNLLFITNRENSFCSACYRNQSVVFITTIMHGTLAGALLVASLGHFYYAWQLPEDKIQQDVMIKARVISDGCDRLSALSNDASHHQRYTVELITLDNMSAGYFSTSSLYFSPLYSLKPVRLILSHHNKWYASSYHVNSSILTNDKHCLHNGDIFIATVRLKPAYGVANPAGLSKQQLFISKGVVATGYIKHVEHHLTKHHHPPTAAFKQTLANLELDNQKWWQALLFGDRSQLTEQDWELLQITGTGHLFSISGMHLSIVATTVFLASNGLICLFVFVRTLSLCRDPKIQRRTQISGFHLTPLRLCVFLFVMLVCWFYASLSGLALPVVRAYILLAIACIIVCLHLVMRPIHVIALMCAACLLIFPLSQLTASFHMSVGAVILIVIISSRFKLHQKPWYVALFQLQFCISVAMVPLTLLWFGMASTVGIVANLIALPLITVMLPATLIVLFALHYTQYFFQHVDSGNKALSLISFFKQLLEQLDHIFSWLLDTLQCMASLNIEVFSDGLSSSVDTVIRLPLSASAAVSTLMALCLLYLPYFRGRYFCCIVLIIPFVAAFVPNSNKVWQVHVFDAGQASAIAITQGTSAIIIDSGLSINGNAFTAKRVIIPFLHSQHVDNIAHVIHTHNDNDHAGGAATILSSSLATHTQSYTPVNGCERGKMIVWDQLQIHFLWPAEGNTENSNAQSCVVKITDGRQSVLIPGDIERTSEYALVRLAKQNSDRELRAELLIAPHHGSRTSSTNAFINAVNPKAVVYTQGYLNRWGFPAKEVQKRYADKQIVQYKTSFHGYLKATFYTENHSNLKSHGHRPFKIESYRKQLHQRWYTPAL